MRKKLLGAFAGCLSLSAFASEKPNIVLFFVDDLGWMDIGVHGSKFYETPNIDKLATEGVRFTQGYTPHPRCLPARYGVITGRFPARDGVPGGGGYLKPTNRTIAHALSEGGYKTGFVGKWHLCGSMREKTLPQKMGFDVNIAGGKAGGPSNYFFPYHRKDKSKLDEGWEIGLSSQYIHGLEDGKEGDYLTDALTTKSIDFIKENKDNPFFLYLSHYAVHGPLDAPAHLVKKYEEKLKTMTYEGPEYEVVDQQTGCGDELCHQNNPVYAAMMETLDNSLGRIVEALDAMDLTNNTVIVFTADNGGLSNRGGIDEKISRRSLATSNRPLRSGKGWLYEGGIREPFIVKWPGVTKAGTVNETDVVLGSDLFATFLDMAGLPQEPEHHADSVSIVSALKGEPLKRGPVFWNAPKSRPYSTGDSNCTAVRSGDYKLIEWFNTGHVELYNLKEDIGELNDLSKSMPEKTAEMLALIHGWRKTIDAPTPEQQWSRAKPKRKPKAK